MSLKESKSAFTLIELSVVLVIVGLIVGGTLVGQDLIRASYVRATVIQIEKYKTAVNTFVEKYNALPGDLTQSIATTYGFAARGPYEGEGDGSRVIEGVNNNSAAQNAGYFQAGETVMVWVDLSNASLIDGSFSTATSTLVFDTISGTGLNQYFPEAKIGNGNYIYVWSGGIGANTSASNGLNYYGLSAVYSRTNGRLLNSNPGLSVLQAYNIDKKIDDGMPTTGRIIAQYINGGVTWAGLSYVNPVPGSATTCYDNGNNASVLYVYSTTQSGGSGLNCALSFQF